MTLFQSLPRCLMSAFGLALAVTLSGYSLSAYAAELEGTVVSVDSAVPAQAPVDAQPPSLPDAPDTSSPAQPPAPPSAADHERWQQDNERWVRDNQHWERDWERNLSEAFGGDHEGGHDGGPSAIEAFIVLFSVIALIIFLCSPLILIGVFLVLRHKAKARHQQLLNNNIDKLLAAGRDIPVELLRGDEPKGADDNGNQAKGIRNICLGSAWLAFLTIAWDVEVGAIGLIWIGLGLSQLLIWYLNKPAVGEQAGQQD